MANKLYHTLGVSPEASSEDIKRAYRRLVLQKHPDKGGTNEAFQELHQAYSILSQPQKRAQYDDMQRFVPVTGTRRISVVKVQVSLSSLYHGTIVLCRIQRRLLCPARCLTDSRCQRCQGTGTLAVQMGPLRFSQGLECNLCRGSGRRNLGLSWCFSCNNESFITEQHTVHVEVPPHCAPDYTLRLVRAGDQNEDGDLGDLDIQVEAEPHPLFVRSGPVDLQWSVDLSLYESVLGFQLRFRHLNNRQYCFKAPTQSLPCGSASTFRLPGLGFAPGGVLIILIRRIILPNDVRSAWPVTWRHTLHNTAPQAAEILL